MKPTEYVIDRIEAPGWAVLESPEGRTFHLPADWLPEKASEGDVVIVDDPGGGRDDAVDVTPWARMLRLRVSPEATKRRAEEAAARRARLKKAPGGDIEL